MMTALYALVVFVSAVCIDIAAARYVSAVAARDAHRAARWSVLQWAAAMTGYIIVFRVTLWVLPAEMLGLYVGTLIGTARTSSGVGVDEERS